MQLTESQKAEINSLVNQLMDRITVFQSQFADNSGGSLSNLFKKGSLKVIESMTEALRQHSSKLINNGTSNFGKDKQLIEMQCAKIQTIIDKVS